MPQLDFYSFSSQLVVVIVLLSYIYIILAKFILPTTSITLKMRAFVFERNEQKYALLVKTNNNINKQLSNLLADSSSFIDSIIESMKEEELTTTVFYIIFSGVCLDNIFEDILEETAQLYLLISAVDEDINK